MLRILRKINLVLLVLATLQGLALWHAQSASAVTVTPFLYEPFYGNWRDSSKKYDAYPVNINASFDHNLPDNGQNGDTNFSFRDGSSPVPYATCQASTNMADWEKLCYFGHTGIDYNLIYAPVTAAYSGTVQYAGWMSTTHDNADLGLMIRLEHKVDGSSAANYRTIYGHLSALIAYTGETIKGEWRTYQGTTWRWHPQIATSGSTGKSPGRHLHFEVRTWYNNAWRVVDPFGWTGSSADPWVGAGGPPSVNLWAAPRRQYPPPGDGPVVIDDNDTNTGGFSASIGWTPDWGGYNNGRLRYRYNSQTQTAWAKWNPTVPIRTVYEIQVFIPNYPANYETVRTHAASYQIYNNGGFLRNVIVDQHRVGIHINGSGVIDGRESKWVSLGRYEFFVGSNSYVRVTDARPAICNTATDSTCSQWYSESSKMIVVDAARFYAN